MSNANRKLNNMVNKTNDMMNSKVTITEAVQIARGVAEDVIHDYHQKQANIQLSMSIQIDLLKELVISNGIITEEDFKSLYMKRAQEIQMMQQKLSESNQGVVDMSMDVGGVEISKEK